MKKLEFKKNYLTALDYNFSYHMDYKLYITLSFEKNNFYPAFFADSIEHICNIFKNYKNFIVDYILKDVIIRDKITKKEYRLSDSYINQINHYSSLDWTINNIVAKDMIIEQIN